MRRGRTVNGLIVTVSLIAATVTTSAPLGRVQAAVDQREMRAREAFAVGQYQEALELFAKLYAEKLHPNYLRNIGRCYQNLGEPDKAITSFKDYLHKAKAMPPEERAEVEGYIKEMEDLKAKRQTGTAAGPTPGAATPAAGAAVSGAGSPAANATAPAVPAATAPPPPTARAPGAELTAAPGPAAPADESSPVYARWWFWALIGGAAAVGLGIAAGAGAFTKTEDAKCPAGWQC